MSIRYKILNPLNGEYLTASTPEECVEFVADLAINLLYNLTHNAPYSIVELNENGSETWRNPAGEETINLERFSERIKLKAGSPLTSIPITPVETMP